MKHYSIIYIVCCLAMATLSSGVAQGQNRRGKAMMTSTAHRDQELIKYSKQKDQERIERQRMEQERYENACYEGTIEAFNEYLSLYPKGKYVHQVNERIAELKRAAEKSYYEEVCNRGTVQGYKEYLSRYPNGEYVTDIKNRIADNELWESAKRQNTISAYRNYLENSRFNIYATQANDAITELESIEEWNRIKDSTTKYAFESFISTYPKSTYIEEARKKIHAIKGLEYYNSGYLEIAYNEFKSAGGRSALDSSLRSKFDECEEYKEYRDLNSSSNENALLGFLSKHPSSKYYDEISNRVAKLKSASLSMYSTDYVISTALSYARDETTKKYVQERIDSLRHAKKKIERQQAAERRKEWWKNRLTLGVELLGDLSARGFAEEDDITEFYYTAGAGLVLRFGKTDDVLNFSFGGKYLYVGYKAEEEDNFTVGRYVLIPANLKINTFHIGENARFYFGGGYDYAIDLKDAGGFQDANFGIGVNSRHFDWYVYGKYFFGYEKNTSLISYYFEGNEWHVGTSMTVYF